MIRVITKSALLVPVLEPSFIIAVLGLFYEMDLVILLFLFCLFDFGYWCLLFDFLDDLDGFFTKVLPSTLFLCIW